MENQSARNQRNQSLGNEARNFTKFNNHKRYPHPLLPLVVMQLHPLKDKLMNRIQFLNCDVSITKLAFLPKSLVPNHNCINKDSSFINTYKIALQPKNS